MSCYGSVGGGNNAKEAYTSHLPSKSTKPRARWGLFSTVGLIPNPHRKEKQIGISITSPSLVAFNKPIKVVGESAAADERHIKY